MKWVAIILIILILLDIDIKITNIMKLFLIFIKKLLTNQK